MSLLFLAAMLGTPASDALETAEAEYRQGLETRAQVTIAREHFRLSAGHFDIAWRETEQTAVLARHRAQAWFLAGDIGRSIQACRDGLRVFPEEADLLSTLRQVRERVVLPPVADLADACRPIPPPRSQQAIPPTVFFAVFAGFNIAGGALLLRGMSRRRPELLFAGSFFMVLSWGGVWTWHSTGEQHARRWAEPVAVVTEPAFLRTGNNAEFPMRFDQPVPAGVETIPLEERGGWTHVRLPGGATGWLPSPVLIQNQ